MPREVLGIGAHVRPQLGAEFIPIRAFPIQRDRASHRPVVGAVMLRRPARECLPQRIELIVEINREARRRFFNGLFNGPLVCSLQDASLNT